MRLPITDAELGLTLAVVILCGGLIGAIVAMVKGS